MNILVVSPSNAPHISKAESGRKCKSGKPSSNWRRSTGREDGDPKKMPDLNLNRLRAQQIARGGEEELSRSVRLLAFLKYLKISLNCVHARR